MSKTHRKKAPLARRADKYDLYQRSVQDPDADVHFIQRVYRQRFGRPARSLREDFCGTAAIACRWVKSRAESHALGVDLDPEPLAWGKKHNVARLTRAQAARLKLLRGNVLNTRSVSCDVVIAFNFSYFLFTERSTLLRYFKAARRHLRREGLFFLDAYGGADAQREQQETRRCKGFLYVWDQHRFDPINHITTCHIHFEFRDGSRLQRAFSYTWRLWTLPEVRELLFEAGFRRADVYWEGTDRESNDPNGVFSLRKRAPADPAWVAYLVAER